LITITALILAAGYGMRIGKPKLMLEYRGDNFLSIILKNLKNPLIKKIFCITNKENIDWVKENFPNFPTILNPNPENGMLSSVFCGVNFSRQKSDGYLIIPVDHPFIKRETCDTLINEFQKNPDSIIKPSYNKKSGHPIIIPKRLIKDIPDSGINDGLNEIIKKSGINQIFIELNDEGILRNINYSRDL